MGDLGWRAKSSHPTREAKPIAGLRDDFGIRVKSAIEAMKEGGTDKSSQFPTRGRGRLDALLSQNRGVEDRAQKDREEQETDDSKEAKRLAVLEAKAALYDELQKRVNLDDEAANDLHEVDFIAKALTNRDQGLETSAAPMLHMQELTGAMATPQEHLHPEDILRQQQAIREQMQGGKGKEEEYSTYDADIAHLQARFTHVDELDEMNAAREAEFRKDEERRRGKEAKKRKEGDGHKTLILKQLMQKRQRLKPP